MSELSSDLQYGEDHPFGRVLNHLIDDHLINAGFPVLEWEYHNDRPARTDRIEVAWRVTVIAYDFDYASEVVTVEITMVDILRKLAEMTLG